MQNLFITLISFICFNAFSQETITATQAKDFVGKEVILVGKVVGTKPMTTKIGDPLLLLDIDKAYPDNNLTVVIFNQILSKLKFNEGDLRNKSIKAKGFVSNYKEKLQIIIKNEADLMIL